VGHVAEMTSVTQSLQERLPTSGLGDHVACVWVQQVPHDAPPYPHRTTPNGSADLIWCLGSAPSLVGPQTGPTEQNLAPGTVIVGIRLRPGAVSAMFGVPARELVDRTVRLDDVWPDAAALDEKLAETPSPQAAAIGFERELHAAVRAGAMLDPLAAETVHRLAAAPTIEVTTVAAMLDISQRHLRRRCEAAIGFPPKVLQRMFRFQRFLALARARDDGRPNLGILAAEAGYADQAHLTREFQRLAGRSPSTALHEATQHCDGNHDHSASDAAFLPRAAARPASHV
jgi:AraC-like DNA-binding protein